MSLLQSFDGAFAHMTENNYQHPTIEYAICVALRGPIKAGLYSVRKAVVEVSYPEAFTPPFGLKPVSLPRGWCTHFLVRWQDKTGKYVRQLTDSGVSKFAPIQTALMYINELIDAFRLVRIGHLDAVGLRTIGVSDCLIHQARIDGEVAGPGSILLWTYFEDYIGKGEDPHGTTALALPHIGSDTLPVARRFSRCFYLIEHGLHQEAVVVAFSILDDVVQALLHNLLERRGLANVSERDSLIRGIKENRLKTFLGEMLKVLAGVSIYELWPNSANALPWLNKTRNDISHNGRSVEYREACYALYASVQIVSCLGGANLVEAEIPVEMFRDAKLKAAWTIDPPAWIPAKAVAEEMSFSF